ncbi:hypothetical protein, partial [Escherichia coli]|uniref:hypothetical protein n=1 Tax=Escherichia coli TaxID=562 RepID=UPI001F4B813F
PRYGFYGCLNTFDWVSDGFLLRRLRVAACGIGLFRRSSETGFSVSDDLFADVFSGQSPRYGFYGCLNTLDGVSDGFLLRRLRVAACG